MDLSISLVALAGSGFFALADHAAPTQSTSGAADAWGSSGPITLVVTWATQGRSTGTGA